MGNHKIQLSRWFTTWVFPCYSLVFLASKINIESQPFPIRFQFVPLNSKNPQFLSQFIENLTGFPLIFPPCSIKTIENRIFSTDFAPFFSLRTHGFRVTDAVAAVSTVAFPAEAAAAAAEADCAAREARRAAWAAAAAATPAWDALEGQEGNVWGYI